MGDFVRYCTNCGAELFGDAKFCIWCGAKLENAEPKTEDTKIVRLCAEEAPKNFQRAKPQSPGVLAG